MLRPPRNLSGVFFRFRNPDTGKFENWCFEDLPQAVRDEKLVTWDRDWLVSLVNILADVIVDIGDHLDIGMESEEFKNE
jgi:hypothetical protein